MGLYGLIRKKLDRFVSYALHLPPYLNVGVDLNRAAVPKLHRGSPTTQQGASSGWRLIDAGRAPEHKNDQAPP